MITLFRHLFSKLLYDELAVRRWLRAGLLFAGTAGVAFADQLAALVQDEGLARYLKIAGVICAAAGGAITAGEKNVRA
jgi:hypothetical protein